MEAVSKPDIQSKKDIDLFINDFYRRVRADAILAPHFADIDWAHHTPIIVDFWAMILLGDPAYKGNPFANHLRLTLSAKDFEQWLFHFQQTIDDHYQGAVAEEAKNRARNIAAIFQHKLGISSL
jgi:hemoglobin